MKKNLIAFLWFGFFGFVVYILYLSVTFVPYLSGDQIKVLMKSFWIPAVILTFSCGMGGIFMGTKIKVGDSNYDVTLKGVIWGVASLITSMINFDLI